MKFGYLPILLMLGTAHAQTLPSDFLNSRAMLHSEPVLEKIVYVKEALEALQQELELAESECNRIIRSGKDRFTISCQLILETGAITHINYNFNWEPESDITYITVELPIFDFEVTIIEWMSLGKL